MKKKAAEATKTPQSKKKWEENLASFQKIMAWLEEGKDVRNGMDVWTNQDIDVLNDLMLLTAKPVLFAINMNIKDYKRQKNKPGSAMIPYCGAFEDELVDLDGPATEAKLQEMEVKSALPKIIKTAFSVVNLILYY